MKKATKIILGVVAALVVIIAAFIAFGVYYMTQGPDLTKYEHLKEPAISSMPNQKMLVVEAKGDPNVVGGKAFSTLFQLYFKMKETPKGPGQPAPRARWPMPFDTPKTEWIGLYAMPVPEVVSELPQYEATPELNVSLTTWEYGEVAEILHYGPYDQEQPTVARLMEFIKAQGYEAAGEHEEEYLKGATMFSKGDPEKYVTIIRYRVKKSEQAPM
ncbi:GyrI-like domain-containing protein [candidate division KSB1 bacterium]|nr:GyrI-like domain-containing protein [candidate division KSB1 bacterium]